LNALTIDGETSTNDCVFILANGNAGNELIKNKGHSYQVFQANLETICRAITIELARDGEGATKVITVNVEQAYNTDQAYIAARAIANSPLVKTAIYGQDPNWGRVISAVGACDINLNIAEIKVGFGGIPVVDGGRAIDYDKHEMKTALAKQDIQIDMILGSGQANATVYTCDLTHEYITINAEYHT
jgi:glutamate N-acetyltransferase/amino-acid N-acetyltransferase